MSIYAVNGKEPIAAWIPSLDTAGNGTTTLTDLVGSNNGTLTNMDAATDWVADTGAGGVRALDFDGVNDHVSIQNFAEISIEEFWLSFWIKTTSGFRMTVINKITDRDGWYLDALQNGAIRFRFGIDISTFRDSTETVNNGQWHHVAVKKPLSGLYQDIQIWIDGTESSYGIFFSQGTTNTATNANLRIGLNAGFGGNMLGRFDDFRFFQSLDSAEVAALYASGLGRGITFGGTKIQTRRRRDLGGFGL